jgi:rod shape determining protein RodA
VAGAKVKHLLIIILIGASVSPMLWGKLSGYQRSRVSSFLLQSEKIRDKVKENTDFSKMLTGREHFSELRWQRKSGYHLIHSKLAIASGGLTGYGFRKGPYIKRPLLPERHNDFVFAIIAHQWGLFGCLVVFLLYGVIVACGMEIAWNNTDPFARLIAVGIITMLMVQVIVNTCMTVGLMPITGITLPLVSYGGSSLVVNIISIGILNNIGRARPFTVAGKGFEGN